MDIPERAKFSAAGTALLAAVLATLLASGADPRRQGDAFAALAVLSAVAAWPVLLLCRAAWPRRRPWVPWSTGAAAATALALAVTAANLGAHALVLGHAATVLLLAPAVHARLRGWSPWRDLRTHPLRWTNVFVALLAATAANLSGVVYAGLEPRTAWGPWTYVALAWLTSALAASAWMRSPWRTAGIVLGGVASLAWFTAMLPYAFGLNLAGHALAAVCFLATAWEERRHGRSATCTGRPGAVQGPYTHVTSLRYEK